MDCDDIWGQYVIGHGEFNGGGRFGAKVECGTEMACQIGKLNIKWKQRADRYGVQKSYLKGRVLGLKKQLDT